MRETCLPANVRCSASRVQWLLRLAVLSVLSLAGCAQVGLSGSSLERAAPLGLILDPPNPNLTRPVPLARYDRRDRDDYVLLWMKRSDDFCAPYKSEIIRVSRDSRLASGLLSTTLSGLAAVFTPVATVRALSGAAAIATGTGAVFQSDTFNGQVGEILTSAIETARRNQGNQIKANLEQLDAESYSIYSALRDVGEYHDMCSLNTALIQIRASLLTSSPDAGLTPPAKQGRQTTGGITPEAAQIVGSASGSITNPDAQLPAHPPPRGQAASVPTGVLPRSVPSPLRDVVAGWQRALCVVPVNGELNPMTLRAIQVYLGTSDRTPRLGPSEMEALGKAVDDVGDCRAKGFFNGFEVQRYGVLRPEKDTAKVVAGLQGALNEKLKNIAPTIAVSGTFDTPTRGAIKKVRELAKINPGLGGAMDNQLDLFLVDKPEPFPKQS